MVGSNARVRRGPCSPSREAQTARSASICGGSPKPHRYAAHLEVALLFYAGRQASERARSPMHLGLCLHAESRLWSAQLCLDGRSGRHRCGQSPGAVTARTVLSAAQQQLEIPLSLAVRALFLFASHGDLSFPIHSGNKLYFLIFLMCLTIAENSQPRQRENHSENRKKPGCKRLHPGFSCSFSQMREDG
jgi:hypothetical protein